MKISLIAVILLCLFSTIAFTQDVVEPPKHEFGISLSSNLTAFSSDNNEAFISDDVKIESLVEPGFSLGVMYRYRFTSLLLGRVQAVLSFTEQAIDYHFNSDFTHTVKRESVNVELPLHFVIEDVDKRIAPSAFFGGRYRFDVASSERTSSNPESFRKDDLMVDVGLGLAIKMKKFTFKPELMYSRGMFDQAGEMNFSDDLFLNQFSLRFSFYGS